MVEFGIQTDSPHQIVAFRGKASEISTSINTWQSANRDKTVISVKLEGASTANSMNYSPDFVAIVIYTEFQ
jgi:hypothetical protein